MLLPFAPHHFERAQILIEPDEAADGVRAQRLQAFRLCRCPHAMQRTWGRIPVAAMRSISAAAMQEQLRTADGAGVARSYSYSRFPLAEARSTITPAFPQR
jgi:hypothetical protein